MDESQALLVGGALLFGAIVAALSVYLARDGRRHRPQAASTNVTDTDEKKQSEVSSAPAGGGSKRLAKSKKRREAQQEFTHSWMVGALKGHRAPVLDMDFSANGNFLASCAEDCGLVPTKGELDRVVGVSSVQSPSTATAGVPTSTRGKRAAPGKPKAAAPPSPSSSTKSTSSTGSGSSAKDEHQRAILSRRQRKNRTRAPREQRRELRERDEDHEDDHNGPPPPPGAKAASPGAPAKAAKQQAPGAGGERPERADRAKTAPTGAPKAKPKPTKDAKEAKERKDRLPATLSTKPGQLHHLTDAALAGLLRRYSLTGDQLAHLGYPVELSHLPGYAVILSHQLHPLALRAHQRLSGQTALPQQLQEVHQPERPQQQQRQQHRLDANAREFVPGGWASEGDSGHASAASSLESSDLEQESASDSDKGGERGLEHRCARCSRAFLVSRLDGEYLREEKCSYHWGKLRSSLDGSPGGEHWECCRGREGARGCTVARAHVWTGLVPGYNGPYHDFARTRPARHAPRDGNYGAYALDCEMCFTKRGLELAKVTVVALDGHIVYEALVRPDAEVIDHNTRFSGLRAKDLARATKSLRDVQKDITSFVSAETILIGHGLENDLRALRLLHPTVVDTCVAFPHFLGYPFRSSLKTLARTVLRREIQVKEHDSAEDARVALDLMLKRLQHDFF